MSRLVEADFTQARRIGNAPLCPCMRRRFCSSGPVETLAFVEAGALSIHPSEDLNGRAIRVLAVLT